VAVAVRTTFCCVQIVLFGNSLAENAAFKVTNICHSTESDIGMGDFSHRHRYMPRDIFFILAMGGNPARIIQVQHFLLRIALWRA
jgi:hypothetical protein